VELRPLIDEAWQLVAIDDKSAEVHFTNLVNAGERVHGNAGQLVQVFVNLLRNALNAVGPNGWINAGSQPHGWASRPPPSTWKTTAPAFRPKSCLTSSTLSSPRDSTPAARAWD
jgi:hypothetical protein